MTGVRGRIVTPYEVLDHGWLRVEDGRVAEVRREARPGPGVDLEGAWVLPGFVDLHVHGGGGHTFTDGEPDAARRTAAFHLRHGTTRLLASLVTASPEQLLSATGALAEWLRAESAPHDAAGGEAGQVVGIHLEGPFLSADRCGAQNPRWLRPPDPAEVAALVEAGRGAVRVVTLAPELPGGLELVPQLTDRGIVAAVGHTDATYDQARAAFRAGAGLVTHACNGMRPAHHREPGVVGAAFDDAGVTCELIVDGVHLHPATARAIARSVGPDRIALITDAIAAAGMDDGRYELGGQAVEVRGGVARLDREGSLAGSTLTMDAAFCRAVTDVGWSVTDASRMASLVPARLLGLDDQVGSLERGKRADLVVLDDEWRVTAVVVGGQVVQGADRVGTDRL